MQVWLGNRRVGEAKLSPRLGAHQITVQIMDEPFSMARAISMNDPVPMTRSLTLKVAKIRFKITALEEMRGGPRHTAEIFNKHGILPSECTTFKDFAQDATVYEFPVIKVTTDQLEEIFDFDWFDPSDGGEPDRDYFERRREEMMRGSYPGL